VAKINQSGSALLYSTYLGGTILDLGLSIAVDSRNRIYVAGMTLSDDFPTVDAAQPIPDSALEEGGFLSGFVTLLKADGSDPIYSTYLGSGAGGAERIAVNAQGSAYVIGNTSSDDIPTTPGAFQRELRGPGDSFIAKISAPRRHHHGRDNDCENNDDGGGLHSRKDRH
jgi:hypothetical protein